MVRLSNRNDINGIIGLWEEAFGDSEKDIMFFLNAHYKPYNTVVYEYDGVIASVLFFFEGDMHIKGIDYPSYYLYAACTLKKYRGRGIMAEMLVFAKSLASERNKFFITLKPAEDSLYSFYSKFGYLSVFKKKIIKLSTTNQCQKCNDTIINSIECHSQIRDKNFLQTDYFKWDNYSLDFAFKHHEYYGGLSITDRKGYMLYNIEKEYLFVKENTFSPDYFLFYVNSIAIKNGVNCIIAELPCNFEIECNKTEIINSGMLLPLCDKAEEIINSVDNAYLALTLD